MFFGKWQSNEQVRFRLTNFGQLVAKREVDISQERVAVQLPCGPSSSYQSVQWLQTGGSDFTTGPFGGLASRFRVCPSFAHNRRKAERREELPPAPG